MPEHAQHHYIVKCYKGNIFGENMQNANHEMVLGNFDLLEQYDIYVTEVFKIDGRSNADTAYYSTITCQPDVANQIKKLPGVLSVDREIEPKGMRDPRIFPHNPSYAWNNDNFGPFTLPSEGMTVKIDTGNICLYEKKC